MSDSIFRQMGSVVKNALDAEETARIAADAALQTSIDNIDVSQELGDLTNVDLTTDTPRIGATLTFDGNNWIPLFSTITEQIYTTPGSYQWLCPEGVTSVCAVCVGGGGSGWIYSSYSRGGGGGGLGWKNDIPVTPGQKYTVVVGVGGSKPTSSSLSDCGNGAGGDSYFINTSTVKGGGGAAGVRSSCRASSFARKASTSSTRRYSTSSLNFSLFQKE